MDGIYEVHVEIAFVVSATGGLATPTWEEASTKGRMIRSARLAVVLADSTKLGAVTFAHVARLDEVDLLSTGAKAPAAELEALRAAGLEIRLAHESAAGSPESVRTREVLA